MENAPHPSISQIAFTTCLILLGILTGPAHAQSLTTHQSDWNPALYETLTLENFEQFPPFSKRLDFNNIDHPLLHAALNFETNRVRAKNRLAPLKWHIGLETAAYHHSKAMVDRKFFSHTSPLPGRTKPEDRAKLAGIRNPKIAENIATNFGIEYKSRSRVYHLGKGQFSYDNRTLIPNRTYLSLTKSLVEQWMKSPGHRANILNTNGRAMGNGVAFFTDPKFNDMVKCNATQKFQWFQEVESQKGTDPYPPKWSDTPSP